MSYKIFTTDNCSYCRAAKSLLTNLRQPFVEIRIGDAFTKEMLLEVVPNATTVPQVFVDDAYIGGYNDLVEHLRKNNNTKFLVE